MNSVLIDVGNTRLKWALLRGVYRRRAAFAATGAIDLPAWHRSPRLLLRVLAEAGAGARVCACNVAGAESERRLVAAARQAGLGQPMLIRSASRLGGVTCGYRQPWRLGVDRLVALVGARFEYPRQGLLRVGVGTALTIDLMEAQGRHLGGCIVPGPALMLSSLLHSTAGIRRRAGGAPHATWLKGELPALFALDTRAGLQAGAVYACAALIDRAVDEARALVDGRPRLLLGGGAAEAVSGCLRTPAVQRDDLVLRGLAVLAGGNFA